MADIYLGTFHSRKQECNYSNTYGISQPTFEHNLNFIKSRSLAIYYTNTYFILQAHDDKNNNEQEILFCLL